MCRVLIVDEDAQVRDALGALLEGDGWDALALASPADAIARIEGEAVDAVITDLDMEGAGGIEVSLAARRHDPIVPVVAVTADPEAESPSVRHALALGVSRVLSKPVDYRVLLETLERVLCVRRDKADTSA
jgi:CheY-like chemotaxis protein